MTSRTIISTYIVSVSTSDMNAFPIESIGMLPLCIPFAISSAIPILKKKYRNTCDLVVIIPNSSNLGSMNHSSERSIIIVDTNSIGTM